MVKSESIDYQSEAVLITKLTVMLLSGTADLNLLIRTETLVVAICELFMHAKVSTLD